MSVATISRVNLGSGQYPLEGYLNIDNYTGADLHCDFRQLHFRDLDEINMSHLLEHISWRETDEVLSLLKGWLAPDGILRVEVPDMLSIMALGTKHPLWHKYVYGDQSHGGEYHLAGFTAHTLRDHLLLAGFTDIEVRPLISEHPGREGMPCLIAEARA